MQKFVSFGGLRPLDPLDPAGSLNWPDPGPDGFSSPVPTQAVQACQVTRMERVTPAFRSLHRFTRSPTGRRLSPADGEKLAECTKMHHFGYNFSNTPFTWTLYSYRHFNRLGHHINLVSISLCKICV